MRPEHVAAVYGHEPLPKAKDPIHLECTLMLTSGKSLPVEGAFDDVINRLWVD